VIVNLKHIIKERSMKSMKQKILAVVIASALLQTPVVSGAGSEAARKTFATAEDAAAALTKAAGDFDVPALLDILGPDSKDLVSSDDPVADKTRATDFAALAREKQSINVDPKNPNHAELVVGNDEWPLPIPLVRHNGKWSFDATTGRKEILLRRIGENELDAIAVCNGYVDAQHDYASDKHDGAEFNQYAQRIISTPGKHDGLAWQNPDGTWDGPVGEAIAKALAQGYDENLQPYHGYYFKVLKAQGPAAVMGQMDFVLQGVMIGGFALAAAPAQYRVTGVETFIVSNEGNVYQKDLGPNTLKIFKTMDTYNPDKTWKLTEDEQ
jgi:hypothetical protein